MHYTKIKKQQKNNISLELEWRIQWKIHSSKVPKYSTVLYYK